jgi:hypothetical protein
MKPCSHPAAYHDDSHSNELLYPEIIFSFVLFCVTDASKYEEYKQKIGVNHEVAIHNTCRGEKRRHKSQRSTN